MHLLEYIVNYRRELFCEAIYGEREENRESSRPPSALLWTVSSHESLTKKRTEGHQERSISMYKFPTCRRGGILYSRRSFRDRRGRRRRGGLRVQLYGPDVPQPIYIKRITAIPISSVGSVRLVRLS